jgi:hypothetical protein
VVLPPLQKLGGAWLTPEVSDATGYTIQDETPTLQPLRRPRGRPRLPDSCEPFGRMCPITAESRSHERSAPGAEGGGHGVAGRGRWHDSSAPGGVVTSAAWAFKGGRPATECIDAARLSPLSARRRRDLAQFGSERATATHPDRELAAHAAGSSFESNEFAPRRINTRRPAAWRIPVEQFHEAPQIRKAPNPPRQGGAGSPGRPYVREMAYAEPLVE